MLEVILVVSEKILSAYVESLSLSDSDSGIKSKEPPFPGKCKVGSTKGLLLLLLERGCWLGVAAVGDDDNMVASK